MFHPRGACRAQCTLRAGAEAGIRTRTEDPDYESGALSVTLRGHLKAVAHRKWATAFRFWERHSVSFRSAPAANDAEARSIREIQFPEFRFHKAEQLAEI